VITGISKRSVVNGARYRTLGGRIIDLEATVRGMK